MEDEKVITLRDVLGYIAGFVFIVSGIVAAFALIWAAWHTFRVSVTVMLVVALIVGFDMVFKDYKKARK